MTNVVSWRGTWRPHPRATPLGLTIPKPGQGDFGLADFSAGTYPACSLHGAMNKVSKDAEIWRCLVCNIGCELSPSTEEMARRFGHPSGRGVSP